MKKIIIFFKKIFNTKKRSFFVFPIIVLIFLVCMSALRISGTSIGAYHKLFYGDTTKDSNLIWANPQTIRSDEWLFSTQMTIAQSSSNYPRFNKNIGDGRDMSVVLDVPYKEWSVIFKPQNLAFFVMPFNNAFAFKWWFMLCLLIISSYFFALYIFKDKKFRAILFSLAVSLSPFVFWWYQSATILSLAYGFIISLLVFKILDYENTKAIKNHNNKQKLLLWVALTYITTCFSLLFYPPFQIPVALIVLALIFGKLTEIHLNKKNPKRLIKSILLLVSSLIVSLSVLAIFIISRIDAIKAVSNTYYPGQRIVKSGNGGILHLFDGFLAPQLESPITGVQYFTNQSEASNFLPLLVFLLVPGFIILIYNFKKIKKIDWILLSLQICSLIFLANMFMPNIDLPSGILLLNRVPHERLMIGLGFLGFLQLLYLLRNLETIKSVVTKNKLLILSYSFSCFLILLWVGYYSAEHYPKFISNDLKIIGLAGFMSTSIYLLLRSHVNLALGLMVMFSFFSIVRIHPLYRDTNIDQNNKLATRIQSLSGPEDTWITTGNILLENIPLMNNRDSLSAIQFYPDTKFWAKLDGQKSENIYNRYAHVLFQEESKQSEKIKLIQSDVFSVQLNCSNFITNNIKYILSTYLLDLSCYQLKDTVSYPANTFYIYELNVK